MVRRRHTVVLVIRAERFELGGESRAPGQEPHERVQAGYRSNPKLVVALERRDRRLFTVGAALRAEDAAAGRSHG